MSRLKNITAVASLALLLGLPTTGFAAGFANMSQSAVANAMAGVATANPDEPNASFYNPAAMAFQDGPRLYLGLTLIKPSVQYTSPQGNVVNTEDAIFPPPNLHAALPVGGNFTVGIGVTFPFGLGIAWPEGWEGRDVFLNQDLQTINVNPNIAYKFPGLDLSLAAGLQVMSATITQERAFIIRDDEEANILLGGQGMGFGGTFAVMYKPTDQITLGLNYRSAVKFNIDGNIHFDGFDDTPIEARFVDQAISTDLTVPHVITAGIGLHLIEELFIGLDVNYTTWSTYDRIEINYSEQSPEGAPGDTQPPAVIEADWSDAFAFRLGAEYALLESLKARAGVVYDMSPVPAETVGPSLPESNRLGLALGAGYHWNDLWVDLGYQHVFVEERIIDNGSVDGTYNMNAHVLGLNFGYDF